MTVDSSTKLGSTVEITGGEVLAAPFDWKRSESTVSEPDLLVLRSEDYDPDGWLTVTPLLVVEIASPTPP